MAPSGPAGIDCNCLRTASPGKRYWEEPASLTSQKRSSCRVPGSKKLASSAQIAGMLAASNHTVRRPLSLMCPCQHIGGVRTRSPSFISQRRPLTTVTAPSARVEKRIAAAVWRCGTARSPGSSTVKAAIRFCVVTVSPPNAGLARISARRSTSSIATSFAARPVKGSISRQRQCIGASLAQGATGVMRLYRSHSGWRFDRSSAWIREASTLVNRSRARTESGDVQQAADERKVLQEVVHLVVELSRIGDFPEPVRRECRNDHEQHEQPRRPASAPAGDEQKRAADLDDDRDYRHHFRGRKAELGEVGDGAGESHHLPDAGDEKDEADENAAHQGKNRVVGRCCADVGHSGSLLVTAIMPVPQSILAPEAFTTLAHLSISAAMKSPNCCGVVPAASSPRRTSAACTSGVARSCTRTEFRRAITSAGVPAGATRPFQKFAS